MVSDKNGLVQTLFLKENMLLSPSCIWIKWAPSRENMSSENPTRSDTYQPALLQRLATANQHILDKQSCVGNALLNADQPAGMRSWSVPLLFADANSMFSHDAAHFFFLGTFFESFSYSKTLTWYFMHFISIENACSITVSGQYMELKVLNSRSGWYADKHTATKASFTQRKRK